MIEASQFGPMVVFLPASVEPVLWNPAEVAMQALETGTLPRGFPDLDESDDEAVQFPTLPLALRYVLLRAG